MRSLHCHSGCQTTVSGREALGGSWDSHLVFPLLRPALLSAYVAVGLARFPLATLLLLLVRRLLGLQELGNEVWTVQVVLRFPRVVFTKGTLKCSGQDTTPRHTAAHHTFPPEIPLD